MAATPFSANVLRDTLEVACMDVMDEPAGPLLASRLQRACLDALRDLGVRGAEVLARADRGGMTVRVMLPPGVAGVRQVVLQLGG